MSSVAAVTGKGRFPEHMLRSDACEFLDEDQEMRSYATVAKRPRTILVKKIEDTQNTKWHSEEWEANRWKLEEVSHNQHGD